MTMLKSFTFYAIVFLLAGLLFVGYLYKNKLEAYAILDTQKTALEAALVDLNKRFAEEALRVTELEQERDTARSSFRVTKKELDELKGKQHIIAKKPGLVEIKINKSFSQFTSELSCTTGAQEQCKK